MITINNLYIILPILLVFEIVSYFIFKDNIFNQGQGVFFIRNHSYSHIYVNIVSLERYM